MKPFIVFKFKVGILTLDFAGWMRKFLSCHLRSVIDENLPSDFTTLI